MKITTMTLLLAASVMLIVTGIASADDAATDTLTGQNVAKALTITAAKAVMLTSAGGTGADIATGQAAGDTVVVAATNATSAGSITAVKVVSLTSVGLKETSTAVGLAVADNTTKIAVANTIVASLTPEQEMEQIIIQRENNQERRIEAGVQKGSLTDAEKKRLEGQLANIEKDFERMKTNTTPGIGPKEFTQLQRDLNKNSADIYRLKHNALTPDKVGKK